MLLRPGTFSSGSAGTSSRRPEGGRMASGRGRIGRSDKRVSAGRRVSGRRVKVATSLRLPLRPVSRTANGGPKSLCSHGRAVQARSTGRASKGAAIRWVGV